MGREAIHVGEHIADELEEMKMTPAAFARALGISPKKLNEILEFKRGNDGDMALRLGHFFNTGPEIWMSRQSLYEIRKAEAKIGKTIKTLPKLMAPNGGIPNEIIKVAAA